jgi:hypothetical protein
MGVGVVIIRELQGIFNARGRSEAFADAAYLVRQAQAEYRAFNPNPSPEYMTENGATLVRRVDSAVHAARKTLIGRMPTLLDLKQATQPMSVKGATKTEAGPTNHLEAATGEAPLPTPRPPIPPDPNKPPPQEGKRLKLLELQADVVERKELLEDTLPPEVISWMNKHDPDPSEANPSTPPQPRNKAGLNAVYRRKKTDAKALEDLLTALPK